MFDVSADVFLIVIVMSLVGAVIGLGLRGLFPGEKNNER